MHLFYLIISILFLLGFDYLGKKIVNFFKLYEVINKISNPTYQNSLVGISSFIFLIFPIFFLGFFNRWVFISVSVLLLFFGFFNIIKLFYPLIGYLKQKILLLKSNKLLDNLVIFLIVFYFLLSISPITSGDSVAYHLAAAKYILLNSNFPSEFYNSSNSLVSAGELLNAFAISINAYPFTSLINFIGIVSVLAIIKKFSDNLNLTNELKQLLFLCVLSSPVLIFLISSSKSQLFSTSLIFFSYALLLKCLNSQQSKDTIFKNLFICLVFAIVAVQTKISFSLSLFLIVINFLLFFQKKLINPKSILTLVLLSIVGLIPHAVWKQNLYNYPFYNFLLNPFPMNIPGYAEVFLSAKNYLADKFPLSLFIPLSLSDLTQFLGVGLFSIFFLIKYKFQNKNILLLNIFIFFLIYTIVGQKSPRFYLEIYFLLILVLSIILKNIYNTVSYKILRFFILLQSIFTLCILLIGVFNLLPGIFSDNLNKKILSKYASGYNLYKWVNESLPKNSLIITNHRSTYFAEHEVIFFEMTSHLDNSDFFSRNYFLEEIKKKKPNFILFYGYENYFKYNSFNFYKCTNGLFSKKMKVGFEETRNPFNTNHRPYNAYIYYFDYSKLPNCVTYN
jgi:hypothetical protein